MAQRNPKPTDKPQWVSTGNDIIEPTGSKQTSGWEADEKPPYQFFNWFWNVVTRITNYIFGRADLWNIIIDTDSEEGDYDTLVDYIADAPAAGDRVLIRQSQTIAATLVIPSDITLGFFHGAELLCSTALVSVLELSAGSRIITPLIIRLSHGAGTITDVVMFDGDDIYCESIMVINTGVGNITNAFTIELNVEHVIAGGYALATGAGSISNILIDVSNNVTNNVAISNDTEIVRSDGARTFDGAELLNGALILENGKAINGKELGGTIRPLIHMTSGDNVLAGNLNNPLVVHSSIQPFWSDDGIINKDFADVSSAQELENKTLPDAVLNDSVSGTAVLDEDDMASDSDTQLITQQSAKAYTDDNKILIQTVNAETGAVATGTTVMDRDDTIPQNTEGDEYMSLAITPTDAANRLIIDIVCHLASNTGTSFMMAALFKDAVANALACGFQAKNDAVDHLSMVAFRHVMVAGTTDEIIFKVRAGAEGAGTTTFNGVGGSRLFGGVLASSVTIKEEKI